MISLQHPYRKYVAILSKFWMDITQMELFDVHIPASNVQQAVLQHQNFMAMHFAKA